MSFVDSRTGYWWSGDAPATTWAITTISEKNKERELKASEVITARFKLIDMLMNESDISANDAAIIVDFLMGENYLSDKLYEDTNKEEKKMAKIVIASGPTASGKTAWARKMQQEGWVRTGRLDEAWNALHSGLNVAFDAEQFTGYDVEVKYFTREDK